MEHGVPRLCSPIPYLRLLQTSLVQGVDKAFLVNPIYNQISSTARTVRNVLMGTHALRLKSPGACGRKGNKARAPCGGRGKVTMRHRLDHGQKSAAALSAFPANRRPAFLFIPV